jgi:hypothetical protein
MRTALTAVVAAACIAVVVAARPTVGWDHLAAMLAGLGVLLLLLATYNRRFR